jgi:hypothetical protein
MYDNGHSRKKCTVTSLAEQRNSRSIAHGAPKRTATQRFLRSLNSLGVIMADSAPMVGVVESAKRTAAEPTAVNRRR